MLHRRILKILKGTFKQNTYNSFSPGRSSARTLIIIITKTSWPVHKCTMPTDSGCGWFVWLKLVSFALFYVILINILLRPGPGFTMNSPCPKNQTTQKVQNYNTDFRSCTCLLVLARTQNIHTRASPFSTCTSLHLYQVHALPRGWGRFLFLFSWWMTRCPF